MINLSFSLHSSPFYPFPFSLPSLTFSLSSSPSSSSYHLDMLLLSLFWRMNGVNAEFCEISKRSTMKSMRDLNWIWRKIWLVQLWSLSSNRWPFHPFWGKLVLISITSLYLSSLDYITRQKKRTESQTMIINLQYQMFNNSNHCTKPYNWSLNLIYTTSSR